MIGSTIAAQGIVERGSMNVFDVHKNIALRKPAKANACCQINVDSSIRIPIRRFIYAGPTINGVGSGRTFQIKIIAITGRKIIVTVVTDQRIHTLTD